MLTIRYSRFSDELELSGEKDDFVQLRGAMAPLILQQQQSIEVDSDESRDPSPYDTLIGLLRIECRLGQLEIKENAGCLLVQGGKDALRCFTDNLPDDAVAPYHIQFDRAWGTLPLSATSLEPVITLTDSQPGTPQEPAP